MFLRLLILICIFYDAAAEFVVTAQADPVVAVVGGDVVLECQLVPAKAPESMEVRWINVALQYTSPVHLYKEGADDLTLQASAYKGRTELFLDQLSKGNVSLKIRDVRVSDRGLYKCFVASNAKHNEVKITLDVTGTGHQPRIEMEGYAGSGVRLGCSSAGWFPQPPVQWLQGNGENVMAQQEPTYQPDARGLYTVHSIIDIHSRSNNDYTCVINNKVLKETREAHIQIADPFFPRASGWMVAFWILVLLLLGAVCIMLWVYQKLQKQIKALLNSTGLIENNKLRGVIEEQTEKAKEKYKTLQMEIDNAKHAGKLECEKLLQEFEKEKIAIKAEHENYKRDFAEEKAAATAEYQKLHTEFEQWKPLVQSEWDRIRSYAATVKLDAKTANACLTVSPDGDSVKGGETLIVPDNPERFDSVPYVLGSGGFTAGIHYWEVKVADKAYWDVGVANGSVQRKGMPNLCTKAGFWTIGRDGVSYGISDESRSTVTVTTRPGKIGVFLELETGRVSFYNADSMFHLYTFDANFADKVYPFFWPGWDDVPITICPVKN
ncbi:butyrophilin subfamily 3 member A1-like [Heterodontus francisci]|uniref:butyrophilin subfamily 3 member A1-like n=1 Tax=Heterodontus francisci TaxID=7792 RepID=UPI00355C3EC4